MADTKNTGVKNKLTPEQKMQLKAVTASASHNLNLVIDQLTSLNNEDLDETLESLDSAKEALKKAGK